VDHLLVKWVWVKTIFKLGCRIFAKSLKITVNNLIATIPNLLGQCFLFDPLFSLQFALTNGPNLLDWAEFWGIGRQVDAIVTVAFNVFLDIGILMNRHIIY
jgi:hypothetical protein